MMELWCCVSGFAVLILLLRISMSRGAEQELSISSCADPDSESSQELSNQSVLEINSPFFLVLNHGSGFVLFLFFAPCIVVFQSQSDH